MAKKRSTTAAEAPAKKAAAPKKAAKAAKPAAAAPKKAAKAAKAPKAAAPKKKAVAVKLTDKQKELLEKVKAAGELGLKPEKADVRGVKGLQEKKLIKGVKNKDTKEVHAHLTKAGEKALAAASAPSA